MAGGGKDGNLFLFNSLSLGTPLDKVRVTAPPQWFGAVCDTNLPSAGVKDGGGTDTHHIHSGPVLWDLTGDGTNRLLYLMGENDNLKAWQITNDNKIAGIGMSKFKAYAGMPGGALSVSYSNNPSTGLVWASVPKDDANKKIVRGMLVAFQATLNGNDIPLLWHSEMVAGRDSVGLYSKFAPPTVADGMVFLGSFGDPNFVDPTGKHNEDWLRPGWLNQYGFLKPFVGDFALTAVWENSTAGEVQVFDWKYEDFRKKYDELWNQGWRLSILKTRVSNNQPLYTAVWRPSKSDEIQAYGWNYADFRKKYDELWNQGWRLYILDNYVVNGQVLYTGVPLQAAAASLRWASELGRKCTERTEPPAQQRV